jgi:hypothetical protein
MRILRITASLMLTAGLAALVSISATWVAGASGGPWVAALRAFSIKFGLICLASAIGTLTLMPRQADVTRPIRPGSGSLPSPMLKTLLAVLAVVAVLQVPALARWWAQDRVLLDQIIGEEKVDSLGLALIPAVLLFSMPAVATVAVITFVLSSVLGSFARAQLTFPILAGCAALQAGLVVGERFVLGGVRSLGEAFSTATGSSGDTLATAQVTDWFGRHDVVASDTSGRLVWIFGAYLAVTLVSAWLSPAGEADDEPDVAAGRAPEPDPRGVPARGAEPPMPDVARFAVATVPAETPGPGVFSDSSYSVRPRRTLLDTMLMQQYATYDIQSIPPTARAKFSFSSTSGILRREPDGPDLAAVRADGRTGLVGRRTYAVEDLATGALLGRLVPSAAREWDIVHGSGNLVARVREESTGVGPWTYVAVAGDREMCRFTWALLGFTVQSAEMDVEFLEGWDGRFDRMLAIALAPMIEHRARVASQRSMS